MINLFLVKKVSQKEGKEPFTYLQLVADLGYAKSVVTMDKNLISELLQTTVSNLFYSCKLVDKAYLVATLNSANDNKVVK